MKPKIIIYWCRRDFRLTDNPALTSAIKYSEQNQIPLLPIFILDSNILGDFGQLAGSKTENSKLDLEKNNEKIEQKLAKSNLENLASKNSSQAAASENSGLAKIEPIENSSTENSKIASDFQTDLAQGSSFHPHIGLPRRLFLSRVLAHFSLQFPVFEILVGNFETIFQNLSETFELQVFAGDDVEPFSRFRDNKVSQIVGANNFHLLPDQLTISPDLRTQTGQIYSVFTPFKKAALESFLNVPVGPKVDLKKVRFVDTNVINQLAKLFPDLVKLAKDGPSKSKAESDLKLKNFRSKVKRETVSSQNLDLSYSLQTDHHLTKKTNFADLQAQIFSLIDTKWSFTVGGHESKIDQSPQTNSEQNLEASSPENHKKAKKFKPQNSDKNSNLTNFPENSSSQIITINLDQILKRPDYLEWPWQEDQVLADFEDFLEHKIQNYEEARNDLGLDTQSNQTSRVSYALKWGLVSGRFLKQKIVDKFGLDTQSQTGVVQFISELMWREFYRYILWHEPQVLDMEYQLRYRPARRQEIVQIKEKLTEGNIARVFGLQN